MTRSLLRTAVVAATLGLLVAAALGAASRPATAAVRGSGPGAGATGSSSGLPVASLQGFACARALDPADRSVSVQAVMRPVPGTEAMMLRVQLLERPGGSRATTSLRTGDLGRWISPSKPGLGQQPRDVWRLDKSVVDLYAPATYRFRVTFRWIGARGRVLGMTTRRTGPCHQRELRPDLLVRSLTVAPISGDPAHDSYTAVIANRGATAAGPFEVLFAPGNGSAPVLHQISLLGPRQSRTLRFTGPVCDPAAPPSVTVDATREVDDLNRANNAATAVCPAGTAG